MLEVKIEDTRNTDKVDVQSLEYGQVFETDDCIGVRVDDGVLTFNEEDKVVIAWIDSELHDSEQFTEVTPRPDLNAVLTFERE